MLVLLLMLLLLLNYWKIDSNVPSLMKMYVYGKSQWITHLNTDVEIFLRFGLGEDFYEVKQPVYSGWDEDKGRNSIELDLDWLAELKLKDSVSVRRYKESDVFIDSAGVIKYLFTDDGIFEIR